MTDRFRYLPCGLHEALDLCSSGPSAGSYMLLPTGRSALDLVSPAGWDHAVRALAAIRGVEVPESSSVSFDDEFRVPGVERFVFSEHPPRGATLMWTKRASTSPAARREALCRCICAALNLRVEEVFP